MSAGAFMSSSAAAPLRRLSASQRDALAQRLLPGWRAWCAGWSLVRADVRVEPLLQGATRVRPSGGWTVAGRVGAGDGIGGGTGAGGALLRESGRDAMTRAAMELPVDAGWAEDSLAASLAASVESSWCAWRDSWLSAVSPADGAHPDPSSAGDAASATDLGDLVLTFSCVRAGPGGDAVLVERALRVAASVLVSLLPPGRADGAVSAPSALAPLPRAIAHLPVRVRVRLGQAALQMGQLIELQPGDVIPLAHPLALPASLEVAEPRGQALAAEVRLGRSGAHWAVRVDPAPSTPA